MAAASMPMSGLVTHGRELRLLRNSWEGRRSWLKMEPEPIHNCRSTIDKCEFRAERVGFEPTIPLPSFPALFISS